MYYHLIDDSLLCTCVLHSSVILMASVVSRL